MRKAVVWCVLMLVSPVLAVSKTSNELMVSAEFPETVNSGDFNLTVEITNLVNKSRVLEVYSYVYKGSDCVSGSWTRNLEMLELEPYANKSLNLTNKLEKVNGLYSAKLRVKEFDRTVDLQSYITINQTLKNFEGITGYSALIKPVATFGFSIVGLVALYVVMKRL